MLETRFIRRAIVVALLVATLALASAQLLSGAGAAGALDGTRGTDVDLYEAVRLRLVAGEPYYPALGRELVDRGFATWPTFHWRMPVVLPIVAALPWPWGSQVLLLGGFSIAIGALLLAGPTLRWGTLTATLSALATPIVLTPQGVLFGECWAAVGIAVSAAGSVLDVAALRLVGGLSALAVRELALPWCVLLLIDAARRGRTTEARVWASGLLVFAVAYALHALTVLAELPTDVRTVGWMGFGGPLHVLRCLRWYPPALVVPALAPWLIGTAAAAAVFPPAVRPGVRTVAIGVLMYLLAFSIFGQPFNDYWGCMLAGVWGITLPYGVAGALEAWSRQSTNAGSASSR